MSFWQEVFSNPVLQAEVIIIFTVFCFQIYFFWKTYLHCNEIENVFFNKLKLKDNTYSLIDDELKTDENKTEESSYYQNIEEYKEPNCLLLESSSKNKIHLRIKDGINNYLLNNFGSTVNYSIIKDIIEREIDIKDHQISQLVPIPLYLGLAATIIGIIFGLFAMPGLGGDNVNLSGVDILINGVKIAMFASLSGLFWTIVLSSYVYSKASNRVLEDKNEQLTYLQEQLLPVILKSDDSGVIGLKASIENFSKFTSSIVNELKGIAEQTSTNLKLQQETIEKVEKLNVTSISKTNIELFSKLEKNMESFRQFSTYIDSLATISENLHRFSIRTNNIELIADKISNNVETSNTLVEFLTAHTAEIKNMGSEARQSVADAEAKMAVALESLGKRTTDNLTFMEELTESFESRIETILKQSIDSAEKRMANAIDNLGDRTTENISSIATLSDKLESGIADIIAEFNVKIKQITDHHIDVLTAAYTQSTPRFDELKNLTAMKDSLGVLSKKLESMSTNGVESLPAIQEKLKELESINRQLNTLGNHSDKIKENTSHIKRLTVVQAKKSPTLRERTDGLFKGIKGKFWK